jgi:predicted MFS family arabinose efflux permease
MEILISRTRTTVTDTFFMHAFRKMPDQAVVCQSGCFYPSGANQVTIARGEGKRRDRRSSVREAKETERRKGREAHSPERQTTMRGRTLSCRPFLILTVLAGLYIFSMFYRVTNAVIAPNLILDLGLTAETLGILSGAYFYSFALAQIPMGPLLDRVGPRLIMSVSALFGAAGAFLFSQACSYQAALWGRVLIGLGMSTVLMGSLKTLTLRFPPGQFSTLMGVVYSAGTLGTLLGASPLAWLTATIGWRKTFLLAGGMTTLLAFLVYGVLRTHPGMKAEASGTRQEQMGIVQSLKLILGSMAFWQTAVIAFFRYGTLVGLQGLWLGPYLMDVQGYSQLKAGSLLAFLAVGGVIGGPISGRLSDRSSRPKKVVALWGMVFYCLCLLPLTGMVRMDHPAAFAALFLLTGFFNTFGMGLYSHIKEVFPLSISGTVMTLVNFFTMAGGAVFMPALGRLIESYPRTGTAYPAGAYHLSFTVCFVTMVLSAAFYGLPGRLRSKTR